MTVAVMTDTVACIPKEIAVEYGIKVVPAANILVNGETFIEGETISAAQCYDFIKKDPDRFMTSAISPAYLISAYQEVSVRSKDILFIAISSALSAVFQTARLAADTLREKNPDVRVRVVDSKRYAGAQGLIVMAAAKAAAQGKSLDEVAALAEQVRERTGGLMLLDTLRYIYRTGRMSKTASIIASMLSIKPINRVTPEGGVEFVDRVRKRREGIRRLLNLVEKEVGGNPAHFMVNHASAPVEAAALAEELKRRFNCLSLTTSDYSPVMGYGAGPGALFIGFCPETDLPGK